MYVYSASVFLSFLYEERSEMCCNNYSIVYNIRGLEL